MCHPYRKATGLPITVEGHFTDEYKDYVRKVYLDAIHRKQSRDTTGRDKMKTSREGSRNRESAGLFGDRIILDKG